LIRAPKNLDEICHLHEVAHEARECGFCHGEDRGFVVRDRFGITERQVKKSQGGQTVHAIAMDHAKRYVVSFAEALKAVKPILPQEWRMWLYGTD